MSQLAMSHGHPNGLRISPQSIPTPSHMQQLSLAQRHSPSGNHPPTSSASSSVMSMVPHSSSMSPSHNLQQSPSHSLRVRTPNSPSMSPDKMSTKSSVDLSVDGSDDRMTNGKDMNALNMTISSGPATSDVRTNSIAALRIKAKEHLENINKNLTMV